MTPVDPHQMDSVPQPPNEGQLIALEQRGMVVLSANEWSLCQAALELAARVEQGVGGLGDQAAFNFREVARRVEARKGKPR